MTSPTFLLAGAARSGTTALAEMLRAQPDVFVTSPKEPHFFAHAGETLSFAGPGDDQTINRVAVTDVDAYRRLYDDVLHETALGDASVSTMYHPRRALNTIAAHAPNVRLVVLLRDPVERAFSAYQYLRSRGYEPEDDFAVALDLEPKRRASGYHHMWHYEAMGRYAEQLAPFIDALGADRVGIWFSEELVADAGRVVDEVCAFIGVRATAVPSTDRINASGEARNRALMGLLRLPQRFPGAATVVRRIVPYRWWHRLRSANLERAELPEATGQRLRAGFADDLVRLRTLVPDDRHPSWL